MIDISSGYRVTRACIYPIQARAVMCNVYSNTVHITRLTASHTSHFTRAYKHSQTYKYSMIKGPQQEEREDMRKSSPHSRRNVERDGPEE